MSEKPAILKRVIARVRCISPKDWIGKAGKRFKRTIASITDFAEENGLPDKAREIPDLGWKALKGKSEAEYSSALKNYSEEERNRVEIELKRRTLNSADRQSEATATKLESEARVAQIKEMEARLALFDNLKARSAIPMWDDDGNMTVVRVQKDFDWDGLQDRFLKTGELPKLIADGTEVRAKEPAE